MENIRLEQKENLPVVTETVTKDSLIDFIYKNESEPQDQRFLPTEEGGVFKYFYLPDIVSSFVAKKELIFPIVKVGDEIAGLAQLQKSPYEENHYWISFISVDPVYQGKGYASKLVEEIFHFAKENHISLEASSYKDEGFLKLKDKLKQEAKKTSVVLVDEEKRF